MVVHCLPGHRCPRGAYHHSVFSKSQRKRVKDQFDDDFDSERSAKGLLPTGEFQSYLL